MRAGTGVRASEGVFQVVCASRVHSALAGGVWVDELLVKFADGPTLFERERLDFAAAHRMRKRSEGGCCSAARGCVWWTLPCSVSTSVIPRRCTTAGTS